MRSWFIWIPLTLAACVGGKSDDEPSDTGELEACELAQDSLTCPECSSGEVTCTYDGISVTAGSCGDCQARGALYQALCDAGVTDDRATIEAETVCGPPTCVIVYDTCNDPCEPLCVPEHALGQMPISTSCDVACTDTALPDPGECLWTGFACEFQ